MVKVICDITGNTGAHHYKLTDETGKPIFEADLCDTARDIIVKQLQSEIKTTGKIQVELQNDGFVSV